MQEYKIYCIGHDGHVLMRHDCSASDDLTSLELAKEFSGHLDLEVWQGARFIARVGGAGTVVSV